MNLNVEDLAAIKQLAIDWNNAWNSADVDALLALYEDNPILLPQAQSPVFGKTDIQSLYQSIFEDYVINGNGEVVEIEVSGDIGYFWSSYFLTATPKGSGNPVTSKGKSIFIMRRQDDQSWKIARLIDNSDEEA